VTISIGLAERDAVSRTPGEVLKIADQALYRAKASGRNGIVVA
jgi:diguanylate cyclase (GGDEF)-like protein